MTQTLEERQRQDDKEIAIIVDQSCTILAEHLEERADMHKNAMVQAGLTVLAQLFRAVGSAAHEIADKGIGR